MNSLAHAVLFLPDFNVLLLFVVLILLIFFIFVYKPSKLYKQIAPGGINKVVWSLTSEVT